ncbi:MAG: S1/P1 Nuclease [Alphaproteobacteria bacterium]|nr:MAG: S1/P1 Nuclease [Alphaproteobacteria bacterium]
MRKVFCLLGGLAVLTTASAQAYEKTGHRVVAELAERHLTMTTWENVRKILGNHSLASVANWADEMKSNPDDYWRRVNVYHYLNVPAGQTFENTERNPEGDVLSAYEEFTATLKSDTATAAEKEHALKFLVHIVGDMHQPMHFGHASDHGGNRVKVMWFDEVTDLHSVWDIFLVDKEKLSFTEWSNFLDKASPEQITTYQQATPIDWVHEGLELRDVVYAVGDRDFSWGYVYKYRPVIRKQLLKGGMRLAGVLNGIFEK